MSGPEDEEDKWAQRFKANYKHFLDQNNEGLIRQLTNPAAESYDIPKALKALDETIALFDPKNEQSLPSHFKFVEEHLRGKDNLQQKHLIRAEAFGEEAQAELSDCLDKLREARTILAAIPPLDTLSVPASGAGTLAEQTREREAFTKRLSQANAGLESVAALLMTVEDCASHIAARFVTKSEESLASISPFERSQQIERIAKDIEKHPKAARKRHQEALVNDPMTDAVIRLFELRDVALPKLQGIGLMVGEMLDTLDKKRGSSLP